MAAGLLGAGTTATAQGGAPLTVTVTRSINRSLPPFTLRATATADSTGVARIDILKGGTLVQTIAKTGMDDLFFNDDFNAESLDFMVQAEDITFDGYADLWLMQWRGAHEVGFAYWIYNPSSGRFDYYKPLSGECGYPAVDSAAQTMSLRCNNGAAGAYYIENTYRWTNGRFTLVRQESQDEYGAKADKVEHIIREVRNGKLRVVKREVIRMDDLN
jgi:hypothetical protein